MFKNTSKNTISIEQVNVLFRASLSGGLSNIFAAWMIYFLVYDTQHTENALVLSVTITILTLVRTVITDTYLRKQNFSLNFSIKSYIFLTFCVGITWAVFEYMQASHNDEEVRNIVFLINFGLIAGSIAILSVWLPAYLIYVLPQAIAIFYVFITLDYDSNYFIAFTFLVFVAVMISTSLNINRNRKKEIELTQHNERLINDLNSEIDTREKIQLEIELAKQHLEHKVDERTKELSQTNLNLKSVIDKKEQAEKSLQYLAYHDELTGLPNKNLLVDRINQSIKYHHEMNSRWQFCFLILTDLKP